jgi:hypothetical protein
MRVIVVCVLLTTIVLPSRTTHVLGPPYSLVVLAFVLLVVLFVPWVALMCRAIGSGCGKRRSHFGHLRFLERARVRWPRTIWAVQSASLRRGDSEVGGSLMRNQISPSKEK